MAERKSVGNYNIHFDKRERRDRVRYSLCPRVIYYLDARRIIPLLRRGLFHCGQHTCPAAINTPMITGAKYANDLPN